MHCLSPMTLILTPLYVITPRTDLRPHSFYPPPSHVSPSPPLFRPSFLTILLYNQLCDWIHPRYGAKVDEESLASKKQALVNRLEAELQRKVGGKGFVSLPPSRQQHVSHSA